MPKQSGIFPKSSAVSWTPWLFLGFVYIRVTLFYFNARGDVIRMMLILNLESIEAHASEADCSRVLEKKRRTKVNNKCVLQKLSRRQPVKAFLKIFNAPYNLFK